MTIEGSHDEERIPVSKELEDLRCELARARTKFPRGNDLGLALLEEVEELLSELDRTDGKTDRRVREEAIQVACVAIRLAQEGDPTWKDGPFAIAAIEGGREAGRMARQILERRYGKVGGDERPAVTCDYCGSSTDVTDFAESGRKCAKCRRGVHPISGVCHE